ncbi:MAG: hypothetical protein H7330_11575 [Hymenobacteraceae bacterium]|nr:hypothetical protein [Hymenobacteraceae bacterium]
MLIFSSTRGRRLLLTGGILVLATLLARPAAAQLTQIEQVPVTVQPRWIDLADSEWARGKNGRQSNFDYFVGLDRGPRNAGFFGQRLRREMTALGGLTPEVELALNRYRRQKKLFLTERFLFATTLIAAGGAYISTDYKFDTPEYILGGVALASLLSNVLVTRNTNTHLQRAVKEYQGGLIPQKSSGRTIDWRPAFGGLAPPRGGGMGVVVGWRL